MNTEEELTQRRVFVGLTAAIVLAMGTGEKVHAASATATVDVRVLVTIAITNLGGLSFGNISVNDTPGVVSVQPNGQVTATGGVTIGEGGTAVAASFGLNGEPHSNFSIQLPANLVLADTRGNTMNLTAFQSLPSVTGQLDGSGRLLLSVGGDLHVSASQPPGDYSGLMSVSVSYN